MAQRDLVHDGLPPACEAVINLSGENIMQFSRRYDSRNIKNQ